MPGSNWVLLAIYELDYAINAPNGMQGYVLFYNLTIQSITVNSIEIGFEFSHQIINNIKISMLIIHNDFLYKDIFSIQTFDRYQLPNTTTYNTLTITPLQTPCLYFPFITHANIKSNNNGIDNIEISWTFDSSLKKFTSCSYDDNDYSAENFTVKMLLIYKSYAESTYSITLQVFCQSQTNNSQF